MHFSAIFSISFLQIFSALAVSQTSPTVTVKNGTLRGLHSSEWRQDHFLGIPYAQPPVGDLRFRWPRSLNTSWSDAFDADRYGYSCYQYNTNFNLSEDCLTLNVVRPAGYGNQTLPVLVWIYGGGKMIQHNKDPNESSL